MKMNRFFRVLFVLGFIAAFLLPNPTSAQSDDPSAPTETVKLIFIHHSTGQAWLDNNHGKLGLTLGENNYFVSETNYGWGPDSIGDRTDIPHWTEWFRSEKTPVYMEALFAEGQSSSSYLQPLTNPGGENQIIMFKSCFPNSNLGGSPSDAPTSEVGWTVGHAKWVYNEILKYFITRPDKLFVVITAPPVSGGDLYDNARAFNNWLVYDWLAENSYPYHNVAVFDYYNVLTAPDAHHRFVNGQIEHVTTSNNSSAYSSSPGDDHPNSEGNLKATEEFVPLLNVFYHRWQASGEPDLAPGSVPPAAQPTPTQAEVQTATPQAVSVQPGVGDWTSGSLVDDFEAANTLGAGWTAYWDEATATRISCGPDGALAAGGARALQITFDVAAESWATCELNFDQVQNWAGADGLNFMVRTEQAGLRYNVDLFTGNPEQGAIYTTTLEAMPASVGGWAPVTLRWSDFARVAWEENGGAPFEQPEAIFGIAIGFNTQPGENAKGSLWIDDLRLGSTAPAAAAPSATAALLPTAEPARVEVQATQPAGSSGGPGLPCGSAALPFVGIGLVWLGKRRKTSAP